MNISEKIKSRRLQLSLKQWQLAERCGMKQNRISSYETGAKVPPLKAIKRLEIGLEVPSGYLTSDNFLQENENMLTDNTHSDIVNKNHVGKIRTRKYIRTWQEAAQWDKIKEKDMLKTNRISVSIASELNRDCFPLQIVKDSMVPKFSPGECIILDPHAKPRFGSYVVVKLLDTEEVLFVQYFENDDHVTLKFLNPQYPKIIKPTNKVQIIGKVVRRVVEEVVE